MDEVEAVACEETQREVEVVVGEGMREVSAEAEAVSDDEGIDGIGLIEVGVGFLEVGGEAWVKGIKFQRPLIEERVLGEGVNY